MMIEKLGAKNLKSPKITGGVGGGGSPPPMMIEKVMQGIADDVDGRVKMGTFRKKML